MAEASGSFIHEEGKRHSSLCKSGGVCKEWDCLDPLSDIPVHACLHEKAVCFIVSPCWEELISEELEKRA